MPKKVIEKSQRGPIGLVVKWTFIGFNILMLFWLFSYWTDVGTSYNQLTTEAEQTGAAIGGTLGTGVIIFFWLAGAVILGLLAILTRRKVLIEVDE